MADAKSETESHEKQAPGDAASKDSGPIAEAVADAVEKDTPRAEPTVRTVRAAVEGDGTPQDTAPPAKNSSEGKPGIKPTAPARQARTMKKAAAKKPRAKKPSAKKPVAKKKPVTGTGRKAAATPQKKPAKPATASKTPSIDQLKETIMATANKKDVNSSTMDMAADMQERAQTAFAKVSEFASETGDFSKANVEAMVESGKIWFSGAQDLVRENVETSKTLVETMTEGAKKVASAKSPTEFMQLQSDVARRNLDAMISYGSERTEAWVKLYNDAFAPISNRASVAAETMAKVA